MELSTIKEDPDVTEIHASSHHDQWVEAYYSTPDKFIRTQKLEYDVVCALSDILRTFKYQQEDDKGFSSSLSDFMWGNIPTLDMPTWLDYTLGVGYELGSEKASFVSIEFIYYGFVKNYFIHFERVNDILNLTKIEVLSPTVDM